MWERTAWLRRWGAETRPIERILLMLIVISLLLHIATLTALLRTRALARDQLRELSAQISQAEQSTISFPVRVRQPVPVRASVPIRKELSVPISTTVAINQSFDIPLDTPLGSYRVPVPIDAQVPIDTHVPVLISETLDLSTTVDLDLNVPLTIAVGEASLADELERLRQALTALAESL